MPWRSPLTAKPWRQAAIRVASNSGTWRPERCGSPCEGTRKSSCRWPFPRTAGRWPRAVWWNTVKLWDVVTGQERATLKGFAGWAAVAFSPDGSSLAMVAEDRNVKLLRAATDPEARARKNDLDPDDAGSPRAFNYCRRPPLEGGPAGQAEKAYQQALSSLDKLAAEFPNVDVYQQELAVDGSPSACCCCTPAGHRRQIKPGAGRGAHRETPADSKHRTRP